MNTNLSSVMTSPISKTMMPISSIQSTLLPSVEGLDLAGRILEWQLKNDNLFPQLSEHLKVGVEGALSVHFNLPVVRETDVVSFRSISLFRPKCQRAFRHGLPDAGSGPQRATSSQADGTRKSHTAASRICGALRT